MHSSDVALAPTCTECRAVWLPGDPERWRLYRGDDEHLDEPAELVWPCAECGKLEFG